MTIITFTQIRRKVFFFVCVSDIGEGNTGLQVPRVNKPMMHLAAY